MPARENFDLITHPELVIFRRPCRGGFLFDAVPATLSPANNPAALRAAKVGEAMQLLNQRHEGALHRPVEGKTHGRLDERGWEAPKSSRMQCGIVKCMLHSE